MHSGRLLERSRRLSPLLLILLLALLPTLAPSPAQAATITVNSKADTVADNGDCTLREAITAANLDTASGATPGECIAGDGDDIITFADDYTITLTGTSGDDANASGDLDIFSNITIQGTGAGGTIIQAGTNDTNGVDRVLHITINGLTVGLNGVTIRYGNIDDLGGGIYNDSDSTVTINDSIISDNQTTAINGSGGGLYNTGTLNINRSTISGNEASGGGADGAGIYNTGAGATLNIIDSAITGNSLTGGDGAGGAGVFNVSGTMNIANSTISGNSSDSGGGGLATFGTANLTSVTITNNTADADSNDDALGDGGGINHGGGTLTIQSSIIAGNIDNGATAEHPDIFGTLTSAGYNLIGNVGDETFTSATGDQVGTSGSPIDPLLDALANNGGSTETHALQAGSPALDQVPTTDCTYISSGTNTLFSAGEDVTTDQRGTSRPQGTACDIGAYEAEGVTLSISKAVNDDTPAPGQVITYTLTISNVGALNTTSAIISDTLHAGLSFVGPVTINPGSTEINNPTLPRLADGVSVLTDTATTVTYQAEVAEVAAGTVLSNTASVSSDEWTHPLSDTVAVTVATTPDIVISKTASSASVLASEAITYTYLITNTGNITLTNVSALDDPLGSVSLPNTTLAMGEAVSGTLVYTTTFDGPDPVTNTVVVSGTVMGGTTVVSDTASASVDVRSGGTIPNINVQKTASVGSAQPGDEITYTYYVTNTGTTILDPVTAEDNPLGTVTLNSTRLLPGEGASGSLAYTVQPTDLPGPLENTVTATGTSPQGDNVTDTDTASVDMEAGPNAPIVITNAATNVLTTSATLNGSVNPNGLETTVSFRWGTRPGDYPNTVPIESPLTGNTAQDLSVDISDLIPDTTHYYIIEAVNDDGLIQGEEEDFTTLAQSGPGYGSTPAPGSVLDVGTVVVSETGTVDLVMREVGSADLIISLPTPALSGTDAGSFALQGADNFPLTIVDGPSSTERLTIACTPPTVGVQEATLTLETNDPSQTTVTYPLRCTGVQSGTTQPTIYLPLMVR